MLRFITCGSVDDGKSTLIGRLLYDSRLVFEDHLAALEADSKKVGTQGGDLDFALLVDGLAAEREQGITIDVAYRFFSTERRKFIVADTPGHEQYTRNMVTGASTADLALILVDARAGVVTQTRRHSFLVSLLGIRHVVLVVNKLDLVGYAQEVFDRVASDFRAFASEIGIDEVVCIPLSALRGDNVTERSVHTPWYSGPTLLSHLETVEIEGARKDGPFRMPVQWVNRPDHEFRGFSGMVVGGSVRPGDRVRVLPSGRESTVARLVTLDGDLAEADVGQSITVTLADEVDVSRGDVLASATAAPAVADQFEATIVWMDEHEMLPGRSYLLKIGARTVGVTPAQPKYKVDVNTLEHRAAKTLALNEIGVCNINLDAPVPFDPYEENRDMGGFILIDRLTNATVAAGLLHFALRRADNLHWQAIEINSAAHASLKGQRPCAVWFTGISGAGKSTIANIVERKLHEQGATPTPRRGQRAARTEQGPRVHRCGSCREHPARGRSRQPDGRRRTHRPRLVHLPLPGGEGDGPGAGRRGSVRGGPRGYRPGGGRGAGPQGALQQGQAGRADQLHRYRFALRGAREPGDPHRHQAPLTRGGGRQGHPLSPRIRRHRPLRRPGRTG
jgi:bifunctional enzyme CysN/CysC